MKYFIIPLAAVLMLTTACHRQKYYTCYCSSLDTTEAFNLGRLDKDEAYNECKAHVDSASGLICNMAVMK